MFCTSCGTRNADNAAWCVKCGSAMKQPFAAQQQQQLFTPPQNQGANRTPYQVPDGQVPNYMRDAVATTFFCFMPFGIVAIIYAVQANTRLSYGDIEGACNASKKAQIWSWCAFGAGIICCILAWFKRF